MAATLSSLKNYLSWQAELGGEDFILPEEVATLLKAQKREGTAKPAPSQNPFEAQNYSSGGTWKKPESQAKKLDSKLSLLQQFQAITEGQTKKPVKTEQIIEEQAKSQSSKAAPSKPKASLNIQNLESLLEEIQKQGLHSHKKLGKTVEFPVIKPNGPSPSPLCLVCEAPSEEDSALGEILRGNQGELLDKMLRAINLERHNIYCSAIVKNEELSRSIFLTQKQKHLELLFHELRWVGCKQIIALGEKANQLLLGSPKPLSALRQQNHSLIKNDILNGVSVFSLEHPSLLLDNLAKKKEAWLDLQWIQKQIQ